MQDHAGVGSPPDGNRRRGVEAGEVGMQDGWTVRLVHHVPHPPAQCPPRSLGRNAPRDSGLVQLTEPRTAFSEGTEDRLHHHPALARPAQKLKEHWDERAGIGAPEVGEVEEPHRFTVSAEKAASDLGLSASIVRPMPKMKTHSGAKKRFRKTAKGKLRGRRAYSSHILEKKSPGRKRQMARPVEIAKPDQKRVRQLLGGKK